MDIGTIIDAIYPLPGESKAALLENISEICRPKGYILMRASRVEPNIYFIGRGIVRAFADSGDGEVTFWFGSEGDTAVSMRSYVAGGPGYENIELLEECALYELNREVLYDLFDRDIHIANWGRKFAERELLKTEQRFISRLFRTASERYADLVSDSPDLLRRVQLGYIASYLGITQVTLSRIRAEIK